MSSPQRAMIEVTAPAVCCDTAWEQAYLQFETPEEEVAKALRRLRFAGVHRWPRETRIAELFCGRGNGLLALEQLGFEHVSGVDLSASLLERYPGHATLYVCDCAALPFESGSHDALIVQGGLHHLDRLAESLPRVLAEMHRVLKPEGKVYLVEPWNTPFLRTVTWASRQPALQALVPKLRYFDQMVRHEAATYEPWLASPAMIRAALDRYFEAEWVRVSWGKLRYLGGRRRRAARGGDR